jgi:PPOX class probable FMN-dependent enzyme
MITGLDQLRALYAAPGERAVGKQQPQLDVHCQRFVALSPFCVMATGGGQGAFLDASPRGGAPGFVKAPDAHTLLLPDATGNNRLDSFANLLTDPRIGLLFLIPGVDETLRVNGTARLRDEPEFTGLFTAERSRPKLVVEVRVAEAYLHCPKALMRSRLWQPRAQIDRALLPTLGEMIHDQMGLTTPPESQQAMLQRYHAQLAQELVRGDA